MSGRWILLNMFWTTGWVPPVVRMSQWDLKIYGRYTEVPWPWLSSGWGNPFRMIFSHLTLWTISNPGFRGSIHVGACGICLGTIRGCRNPIASPRVTDRLHLCCYTANAINLPLGMIYTTHVLWWFIIWFATLHDSWHESSTTYHCCDHLMIQVLVSTSTLETPHPSRCLHRRDQSLVAQRIFCRE